ncbi:metallophosphoesterase [Rhizobium tubonense]|uniref:Metallophosphoesterase n=1 Tax=Rhizobium tubonense TaxID=484088 RepID=A0A2W4CSF6_9HYPH|nr:metallophosphoesterase [Rhizobium tubonense]PZM15577.1 metallophosphoesterase [Rhizobium tubonense]
MTNGSHVFAIGDVHGREDLLVALVADCRLRSEDQAFKAKFVFLGDIFDKGPKSRGALDFILSMMDDFPNTELILGNHDEFILRILDEPDEIKQMLRLNSWMVSAGGLATIRSYKIPLDENILTSLRDNIDKAHLAALRSAKRYVEVGQYILVHAGLRPGVALEDQKPRDLTWIREEFLYSDYDFGKIVVHGHSVTDSYKPEVYPNRIAIDTGAYESDRLTAAHIRPNGDISFIATVPGKRRIDVEDILPLRFGTWAQAEKLSIFR